MNAAALITRRHGTVSGYQAGCRCVDCGQAKVAYGRQRRRSIAYGRWQGRVDATGTRRRAQAMLALGWPYAYQAERLGMDRNIYTKMLRVYPTLYTQTARAVADLYEELSGTVAPDSWSSRKARRLAARLGYPPPLAWDDETIDDPAAQPQGLDGDRESKLEWGHVDDIAVARTCAGEWRLWATLNRSEKTQVVARLLACGVSRSQAADRLHVSGSTLVQYIEAAELAEVAA